MLADTLSALLRVALRVGGTFSVIVLVCVAGYWLLRALAPCILAVARQTLAEALRMKIAAFFIVLMLLGFWAATSTKGDGTVSGQVQSFLAYSITTLAILLSLLTVFLARSLSDELVHRQILMLMAKPLARWQYVAGKWLGIVALNGAILSLVGTGIFLTVTLYLAKQPPSDPIDAERLTKQVLIARHASPLRVPDFSRQARQTFNANLEEGRYDEVENLDAQKEIENLKKMIGARWAVVPPLSYRDFEFDNVLCDRSPDSRIQIHYKAEADRYPPDEVLRSLWRAGDPSKGAAEYDFPRRDVGDRFHAIGVPADAVAPDRTFQVRFMNFNPFEGEPQFDSLFVFQGPQAVEVLFEVGTFGGNLIRLLLLVEFKLMFLAAASLMFATVFSFPVATLCSLTVYVLAASRSFIAESFDMLDDEGVAGFFGWSFSFLLKGLYLIVPNFSAYNVTDLLVDGRNITLVWVAHGLLWLVGVSTSLALLMGCILFQRREVAEVSV